MRLHSLSTSSSLLPRKIRFLAGSIAACVASLLASPDVSAQSFQWDPDGDETNGLFGGAGTWDISSPFWFDGVDDVNWPNSDPSALTAVFAGSAGGAVSLGDSIFANTLTFSANNYSIGGGLGGHSLTLNGTTPTITVTNPTDNATISAILAGTGFTKAGAGTLTLSGTASNTFTGTLISSAGNLDLAKTGGASAVSGNLTVTGGAVRLIGNDQISDSSAVTISGGGMNLLGFNDTVSSLTMTGGTFAGNGGTLTLASTGNALSIRNVAVNSDIALTGATGGGITFDATSNGTGTITGNLDLGAVARVITVNQGTAATDLEINGVISGTQGFSKGGDGVLLLTGGANTYSGTAFLNRGNLVLSKTSGNAITGDLDVSPTGGGSGNPVVELGASNQIADSALVTLRGFAGIGGGALDLQGNNETISGLTIINNQGSGSVVVQTGGPTSGGTLTLLGDVTVSGASTATTAHPVVGIAGNRIGGVGGTVSAANVGTLDLGGGTRTFNVSATANTTIGSRITNGGIIKTGTTVLVLENANNNYTGITTVNGGTLRVSTAGALPAGNDFRVLSGTLDFNNTSFTTVAGGVTIGGGAAASTSTIATGTGTLTLAGNVAYDATNNPGTATISGRLDLGGLARVFSVADSSGAANDLAVSALISNGSITKTGNGVLSLSGTNTFDGLTVQGGLVAYAAEANLGAATNPVVLDGGGVLNSGTAQITVVRPFTINSNGGTFSNPNGTNHGKFLFSTTDTIRGAGLFTKAGANGATASNSTLQVTVSQPNFTGDILLTGGFLELSNNVFQNAGTITVDPSTGQLAELVAGNGVVPNNVLVKGGSISADNGAGTFSGSVTFQNAGAIRLNDFYSPTNVGRNVAITGKLSGGGAITVGGSLIASLGAVNTGVLTLSNETNDFTGGITVQKALSLTAQAADGSGSVLNGNAITLAGGKLNLRDDGAGSGGTISYGNNITVTADAGTGTVAGAPTIDANRALSTVNANNAIDLGTLSIGAETLTVSGGNGYSVRFGGLATMTGATTFNPTTATLTLAGGLSGPGLNFTKTGAGTLRILGTMNVAGYTHTAGTVELPTEPGAGRSLDLPFGMGFGAGYAATQANLIDHVTLTSAGVVGLGVDSTFNPDFTGFTGGLRLGSSSNAILTGTITPAASVYLLGGAGGILTLATQNALTGARSLDVNVNGTAPGTLVLANSNDYTGATSVGGGMILRATSNASLGSNAAVSLDNATLQLTNGGDFSTFNTRVLTAGAGGAILDTNGASAQLDTAIAGTGTFTKTGAGTLTLANTAATYAGKTSVTGGVLAISADTNLGAVPGTVQANQLTLNGGTLLANGTLTIPANRGITVGTNGATFNVAGANNLTLNSILTGANAIDKEGTGTLTIGGSSTTGLVSVNSGNLDLSGTGKLNSNISAATGTNVRILGGVDALGDAITVTLNGTSNLVLNGGATETIGRIVGSGTVTRTIAGTHTLTLNSGTNAQFDGVIQNGSGTIAITKNGANTVTFTGANTYSGNTSINTGAILVQGAAGALGNTAITVGDNGGADETLTFGNVGDIWATGALNRLGDTGSIILNSSNANGVVYNGPAAGSSGNAETMGTLTFSNGRNFFTINPGTGNDVQLTTGNLTRANLGFGLIRGANLGSTGVGSTRLVLTNTSTLIGANGAEGTATKSIVPFVVGDASATGVGTGFLTPSANGLRLLTNAEYAETISGATALRNVSLAGGEAVSSSSLINSIRVTGGTTTINAGQTVRLQSGAVLFTGAGTVDGAGSIDAGSSDAIFTVSNSTGINGAINSNVAALGGVTITGFGGANTLTLGGNNDIAGTVSITGNVTLKVGSSQALNDNYPATLALRWGGAVQLNGNDVTVRNLATIAGGGTYTNGAATAATLTTYLTAGQSLVQGLANGSTGALNLIVAGGQTLSSATNNSYSGFTELRGANLALSGNATGLINQSTAIAINGGFLRLTNNNTSAATNRILDTAPIAFNAGTIDFDNNASDSSFSETVGAASLVSGANVFTVDKGQTSGTARNSVLTFASLARSAGATLNFTSQSNNAAVFDLGTGPRSRLVFTTAPTLDDGILGGWATIDSSANTREFVKYVADVDAGTTGNQASATALIAGDYTAALVTGSNPAHNVKITASPAALAGATQVNSLNFAAGMTGVAPTLDLGANTLRIESGGVIASGGLNTAFNNGTLTVGNGSDVGGDLVVHGLNATASGLAWVNASDTVSVGNVPNGTPVSFSTTPAGLTAGTTYFVVNSTATTFQVATTVGGTAILLTNDGTTGALTYQGATTIGAVIADNGSGVVNFVKAGNNTMVLTGTNTHTGKTFVNGGVLRIASDANLGTAPLAPVSDKVTLSNSSVLELTASMTLDANRGIAVGAGSNIISIPAGTAGNGRTLTYNGAISSVGTTEGSIQFKGNATTTNVDAGKISANLGALNVNGNFAVDAGAVTVNGTTANIGRSLSIGNDGTASFTYTGAGNSLTVGKGITDSVNVGVGVGDSVNHFGTLNLSGLGEFTANVDTFNLGVATGARTGRGIVTLANNNSIVAGTSFAVGFSNNSGNNGVTSSLTFGSGVNNVTTKTFTVGGLKSVGTANVVAGGTVNLGGFGANTLDLLVGSWGNTGVISTAGQISLFDMTGGILNASVNRLAIGEKLGGNIGNVNGTLTLGANAHEISAISVFVGRVDGSATANSNATAGIFNFGGGSISVSTDVALGSWTNNTVGTPTATGTLNITGGNFTVGGNITTSVSTFATGNLNLDGGTLDLTAGNITVDSFSAKAGTLKNVAQIFGGDGTTPLPLTKTTAGTMILDGVNTYSGGTNANVGTLLVNGSITGTVAVASGATLGGDGSIGGAVTLANNSTLAPGNSPGSLDTGNLTFNGGTFAIEIAGASSYDQVNVTGSVDLTAPVALTLDFSAYNPMDLVDSFTLIANDGTTDLITFSGGFTFNGSPIVPGMDFEAVSGSFTQAFQLNINGGDGNDLVLAAVPEPASAMTLLVGTGVLFGMRRNRRRNGDVTRG